MTDKKLAYGGRILASGRIIKLELQDTTLAEAEKIASELEDGEILLLVAQFHYSGLSRTGGISIEQLASIATWAIMPKAIYRVRQFSDPTCNWDYQSYPPKMIPCTAYSLDGVGEFPFLEPESLLVKLRACVRA